MSQVTGREKAVNVARHPRRQPPVDPLTADECLLRVDDLRTWIATREGTVRAVDGVSFDLRRGKTLGIVGESGSGKTVLLRSILNLLPKNAFHPTGRIEFAGAELTALSAADMRHLWGASIAMVFQDPMLSLNPVRRIGEQLAEGPRHHLDIDRAKARALSLDLLDEVGISEPASRLGAYPHELSGGMRQRLCIAAAIACRPQLLLADEPTTALDVTIQRQILDLLGRLRVDHGLSMILITHNLAVIAGQADEIAVMYAGRIVEKAPTRILFTNRRHPYTAALLGSIPLLEHNVETRLRVIPGLPPSLTAPATGCAFAPRCFNAQSRCFAETPKLKGDPNGEHTFACFYPVDMPAGSAALTGNLNLRRTPVGLDLTRDAGVGVTTGRPSRVDDTESALLAVEDLVTEYVTAGGSRIRAVSGISFDVRPGETLGLVGESGCGKSTAARSITMLTRPTSGRIVFDGRDLATLGPRQLRHLRARLQMIHQDPTSSLNPRRRIRDIILEGASIWKSGGDAVARAEELMRQVGLIPDVVADRRPSELSGGQCQRVAIARALLMRPALIVCDEIVSALDVSVQAQILNLLKDLKRDYGLTVVFIAHDLAVIKNVSDRVAVMYLGKICEVAPTNQLFETPGHPYTRTLLEAVPRPEPNIESVRLTRSSDVPSAVHPPSGCRFSTRCSYATSLCSAVEPELRERSPGHLVACHYTIPPTTQPDSTK